MHEFLRQEVKKKRQPADVWLVNLSTSNVCSTWVNSLNYIHPLQGIPYWLWAVDGSIAKELNMSLNMQST